MVRACNIGCWEMRLICSHVMFCKCSIQQIYLFPTSTVNDKSTWCNFITREPKRSTGARDTKELAVFLNIHFQTHNYNDIDSGR